MAVAVNEWLDLMDREYLEDFIVTGGAAVKFVVADDLTIVALRDSFAGLAARHGLVFADINSAALRLHMIHDLFFAISREIDWEADTQRFVEALFQKQGYSWPSPGQPVALAEIAAANKVDATILRRYWAQWLTETVMSDTSMAQDFRIAVMQLCMDRLAPAASRGGQEIAPILLWLKGELKILSALKEANIFTKITRHNARPMLRSLCRWLNLSGHKGLFLSIDIRQVTLTAALVSEGVKYSSSAVMDAYEVLRQLVDDADLFDGFFVTILAGRGLIEGDKKRSVDVYQALKMRIWDDVRASNKDNPLAPMVVLLPADSNGRA